MHLSKWKLCAAVLGLYACAGCAAMFDGTKSDVMFTSEPSGATIEAGDQKGTTPVSLKISKKLKTVSYLEANGTRRDIDLERRFQAGFLFLDIFFTPGFGLSGILIDGVSGAWYKHAPLVHCDLTKPAPAAAVVVQAKDAAAATKKQEPDRAAY